MKITEKIDYLQTNHFNEWLKTRQAIENELSNQCKIFCICGRLATGLHESNCRKFNNRVTTDTMKKLEHLITKEAHNGR